MHVQLLACAKHSIVKAFLSTCIYIFDIAGESDKSSVLTELDASLYAHGQSQILHSWAY